LIWLREVGTDKVRAGLAGWRETGRIAVAVKVTSIVRFGLVAMLVAFSPYVALAELSIHVLPLGDLITYGSDVPGGCQPAFE
jgi:hypothetical protein